MERLVRQLQVIIPEPELPLQLLQLAQQAFLPIA